MNLILDLPEDIQQRLNNEAQRAGLSVQDYVLRMINQNLPASEYKELSREEWIKVLRSGTLKSEVHLTHEQLRRENIYED